MLANTTKLEASSITRGGWCRAILLRPSDVSHKLGMVHIGDSEDIIKSATLSTLVETSYSHQIFLDGLAGACRIHIFVCGENHAIGHGTIIDYRQECPIGVIIPKTLPPGARFTIQIQPL